jgi:hypothetical protein
VSNPGAPELRKALETRLAALVGALPTQWQNLPYVPVAQTAYQQVALLLADPINPEIGRMYQENGYMQITLRYPLNTGPGAADAMAQSIRDWFYYGLPLAANGLTVTINKTPTISPSFVDGDRYCIPVKVRFFANVSI